MPGTMQGKRAMTPASSLVNGHPGDTSLPPPKDRPHRHSDIHTQTANRLALD